MSQLIVSYLLSNRESGGEVKKDCSLLLVEAVSSDLNSNTRLGLCKHWVTDVVKIQKIEDALFQIQPVSDSKCISNFSDVRFCYDIDGNVIRVKQDAL